MSTETKPRYRVLANACTQPWPASSSLPFCIKKEASRRSQADSGILGHRAQSRRPTLSPKFSISYLAQQERPPPSTTFPLLVDYYALFPAGDISHLTPTSPGPFKFVFKAVLSSARFLLFISPSHRWRSFEASVVSRRVKRGSPTCSTLL